ncbi:MAG: autotransporter [Patulibacter sp.]
MTIPTISALPTRPRRRASALVATLAAVGLAGATVPAGATAKTVSISESVSLKLTKKSNSKLSHRGTATGTIPGSATAQSTLRGLKLNGTVTIKTKRGDLRIKINGTARSSNVRTKFDGTATMDGGTGIYRKARGTGKFDGIVNRSSWAATIRATGKLTY